MLAVALNSEFFSEKNLCFHLHEDPVEKPQTFIFALINSFRLAFKERGVSEAIVRRCSSK